MQSAYVTTAARRIQTKWRAGANRRAARNQASYRGRVVAAYSRVPSYLRVKGTKAFQMTCQPFCLALGQGTAGTQGINWYPLAGVPAVPAYVAFSNWAMGFTLAGVNCCINGLNFLSPPMNNFAEYTVLFDSYRIRKVQITMMYNSNSSTLGPGTSLPIMSMANDYDDVGAISLASLQQYDSYRCIQFGNNCRDGKVTHTLRPRIQTVVETTAGTVIGGSGNPWIDCNTSTVQYHGVKGNYDNMNIGSVGVGLVTFYVKYFVEFKNSR